MIELVNETITLIENNDLIPKEDLLKSQSIIDNYEHVILSQGKEKINVLVEDQSENFSVEVFVDSDELLASRINKTLSDWDIHSYTALQIIKNNIIGNELSEGIKYTKEGMKKRVLEERLDKAKKANYKVKLSKNLYGEHTLINEKGKEFKITLWDFTKKTGYINNIDWKTNKLATTKHIMFLFDYLETHPAKTKLLKKDYPFIDIHTDPLNDYKISWFFPGELSSEEEEFLTFYFGTESYIEDHKIGGLITLINKSITHPRIKIREEVLEKIESYFEREELQKIQSQTALDFSFLNATLYPYQKEGVHFSVFKKGVIIADEMGLGKTIQAIATAVLKKTIFDFKKTLVVCPASVKHQWKNEILKFTKETATVVEGPPEVRNELYSKNNDFFHIINYETILRDLSILNKSNYDFIILDEAQKIKNYETKTANAVKAIRKKHALVITGTPIENKLLDLYSIMQFVDQKLLAPQWELSYQHCIFDSKYNNKILGYYDLKKLKKRLQNIIIRREKQDVFKQLPNIIQKDVFVSLSSEQANMHASYGRGIAKILGKKFKTQYDWQRLMLLLGNMRMVCDSTFLVDKETNNSPKLVELRDILVEKLLIKKTNRKVIIFSEWVTMLKLIGEMLQKEDIAYTMLTGKVPVKKRGDLIKEFEENLECSVFLSSESGGAGLNLQVADTVINFELPWNPAKKNQRIGRIDRIGQKKQTLHVFNLLSYDSIEMKIATGLLLKQNLFNGVLSANAMIDEVDFSEKGKSQFIRQLENAFSEQGFINDSNIDIELPENLEVSEENIEPFSYNSNDDDKKIGIDTTTAIEDHKPQVSNPATKVNHQQIEQVMTKGIDFLAGIYKMSTGNDMNPEGKPNVKVNEKTGEVSIVFKLDVF